MSATHKLSLAGKVAIVTGGSSGFGLAIVNKFAAEGAHIVIFDLPVSKGTEASSAANSTHPLASKAPNSEPVIFFGGDVTKEADWRAVLDLTVKTFGTLDIVVNNAGITYRNKPTENVTEADFDSTFNVNVKGIYLSTNVILPYFLEKHNQWKASGKSTVPGDGFYGGNFIQISSTAALRPRPGLTWYNASKGAVSIATKTMAVEFGPKSIRFNSVCPVASDTPLLPLFMGEDTPEARQRFINTIPLGRLSRVTDIANAAAFLASEEAVFISGVDLEVDGGRCV